MPYSTDADIYLEFGEVNVKAWADLDANENATTITNRIARAIENVDAEIDARLRAGMYEVPFTTVPKTIRRISALMAGIELYEGRRLTDRDPEANEVQVAQDKVEKLFRRILAGQLRLEAGTRTDVRVGTDAENDTATTSAPRY